MKIIPDGKKWFYIGDPTRQSAPYQALTLLISAAAYLAILLSAHLFTRSAPLIAVLISWIWFLAPGFLLSYFFDQGADWWERIPLGFVLSVGIATPFTIIAILFHFSLDTLILIHAAIFLAALILRVVFRKTKQTAQPSPSSSNVRQTPGIDFHKFPLLIFLIVLVGFLAFLSLRWPITGDDTAILPLYGDVLKANRITGTEPFHGSGVPVTPRNELIVATYLQILIDKVSGTHPSSFIINSRPILVIMAFLSLAFFLHRFIKDKQQTFFLLCLWGVFLLATTQVDKTGGDFITRIFQDKFLGWFIVVPVALTFVGGFLENRDWIKLAGFGMVTFGASTVHPITLTQIMILTGGFVFFRYLIKRTKQSLVDMVLIAAILLLCTVIPFIQYIRFSNLMPTDLAGLSDAVEFGKLSAAVNRNRLWLLEGGQYILHPASIFQPVILGAYVLLPWLFFKARKLLLNQLVISSLVILPLFLYVPILAKLTGMVVTPYLLWRLAWPLPLFSVFAIGNALWAAFSWACSQPRIKQNRHFVTSNFSLGMIAISLLIALPGIREGLADYTERRSEVFTTSCFKAGKALQYLSDVTDQTSANVLSTSDLNLCIPGYAPNANVVEFRGYGTVNRLSFENIQDSVQRVKDVDYFSSASMVDDLILKTVRSRGIEYILIQKNALDLDLQLKYTPLLFQPVYEDTEFHIYRVLDLEETPPIIDANTALREKQYEKAKELYTQALQNETGDVLSYVGIGFVEEMLGNSIQAIEAYEKAVQIAYNEPAVHVRLARAYVTAGLYEKSAAEYRAAIRLSPEQPELYKSLAELYLLTGQVDHAVSNFELYAELNAPKGSAQYYSLLGNMMQAVPSKKNTAIDYQENAISIQPDVKRYVDLARMMVSNGETDKAIAELQKTIRWDRWSYLPHLEIGYIYWDQGDLDQAVMEFEQACRLNPTNVSAFVALGLAAQQEYGLDLALQRLEIFRTLNHLLPGPYRSYAILMTSIGNYDYSLEALSRSATIQPQNAAIFSEKGYVSLAAGNKYTAYEAFDQALAQSPDLISAKIGLSKYYSIESRNDLETGQILQIAQLMPASSYIHRILAEMYRQKGDYPSALNEIEWAARLDPGNSNLYIARGDIHRFQSQMSDAKADYTLALKLDPRNAAAAINLGQVYEDEQDFTKAEEWYKTAREIQPDSVNPVLQLADLYRKTGREVEARELEAHALEMQPDSNLVLLRIAETYRLEGQIDDAKLLFTQILQTTPGLVSAQIGLAQLVSEEDNGALALYSIYNGILSENAQSARANLAVSEYLLSQGQFDLAEQILENSLILSDVSIDNYLLLARLQQRLGDRDTALSTLETATRIFPREAKAYNGLAYFYLNEGDRLKAERYFNQAIIFNPALISAYTGKSQIHQIQGDNTNAEQVLHTAVQRNPGSIEALLTLASFYESAGNTTLAEQNIQQALDLNPKNIETREAAGAFYTRQHRYTEANANFDEALNLPGKKTTLYIERGNLEFSRLGYQQAIRWYDLARLEDQGDVEPLLALAQVYQAMRDFTTAETLLIKANQIEPSNAEVLIALAGIAERFDYSQQAKDYYEQAVLADQNSASPYIAIGYYFANRGQFSDAIRNFEQAQEINSLNLDTYVGKAKTYLLMNDCPQALSAVRAGAENSPDKQDGYLAVAAIAEACGEWESAKQAFELAWSVEPGSNSGALALVDYLIRRNEMDQALSILQQMASRYGPASEVSNRVGKIYRFQAKWTQASEAFQYSIMMNSDNKDAYLGLASIYELQGDWGQAITQYRTALRHIAEPLEIYLKLGNALLHQGEYKEARDAYQAALDIEPLNLTAITNMGQINTILGTPGRDILEYVNDALVNPSSTGFLTISQLYLMEGDTLRSLSWIQKSMHLNPVSSANWSSLGNYYLWMGQLENALGAFKLAAQYHIGSASEVLATGTVKEALSLYDEAKKDYLTAIQNNPGGIQGYIELAELLLASGENEEAFTVLQQGINKAPWDYRGYETLGNFYRSLDPENIEKAENAYQTGLSVLPGSSELYVKIADLHNSQAAEAWKMLTDATEQANLTSDWFSEVQDDLLLSRRGSIRRRVLQEDLQDAAQQFEKTRAELIIAQEIFNQTADDLAIAEENYKFALTLDHNNISALQGLGELNLILGTPVKGLALLEEACLKSGYSDMACVTLGNLYDEMGQTDSAVMILVTGLNHDPNHLAADLTLANAYRHQDVISITQAASSVEQSITRFQLLVSGSRNKYDGE